MVKLAALFLVVTLSLCVAYQLTRCYLVKELIRHNMPDQLENWVCLAERLSKLNTGDDVNEGKDRWLGLFHFYKSRCSNTTVPGGTCNITCADLLKDDLTETMACAKKNYHYIVNEWPEWKVCQGKPMPEILDC